MSDDPYVGFDGHPEEELTNAINDVTIQVNDSIRNAGVDVEKRPNVIIKEQRTSQRFDATYQKGKWSFQ